MSITYDLAHDGRPTIRADPQDNLDYHFDWTEWLAGVGDSIASFSLEPSGGVVVSNPAVQGGVVSFWLTGGQVGVQASVRCSISTVSSPPRVKHATLYFDVQAA